MVSSDTFPDYGRNVAFQDVLTHELSDVVALDRDEGNPLEAILDIGGVGDEEEMIMLIGNEETYWFCRIMD